MGIYIDALKKEPKSKITVPEVDKKENLLV
jgi:hypothetical protein